jgi:predicted NUDIX family NTP pyrophosphohydrolase
MPAVSAGLLIYRRTAAGLEALLVHPGGPYWAKKDSGAWSIPKGEAEPGELGAARPVPERDAAWRRPAPAKPRLAASQADLLVVARRETREETGLEPPGPFAPLGGVKAHHHKLIYAWAVEFDCDAEAIVSNQFEIQWPPRSGRTARFPEVDRAAWFDLRTAREKIVPVQRRFLDDLMIVAAGA